MNVPPSLQDPEFDPDQYSLSQRHTALKDLCLELRSYLGGLKSELVSLINEDYEDLIGLGMGLTGTVEQAMGKMKAPIGQAKQDVLEARRDLGIKRGDLKSLLNERCEVIEGKKLVRLMLDCGDSVTSHRDAVNTGATPTTGKPKKQTFTWFKPSTQHSTSIRLKA
ncbi:hypothetical protein H4Q26_007054 [Puccinia striiformis f. sp. tritici PST-130]|nr:hypothetical protein H4Q26_007054 [Puccinia striiformis f. sp. tritici PST-130]